MLEHTKAVIFDLDGTLVDSMWVWTAIDEDYIRKYHLNPPEDFHEAMEGMSYTETAQYFLKIFPELQHTVDMIKKERGHTKARGKGISGDAERERDPDRNRNQQ